MKRTAQRVVTTLAALVTPHAEGACNMVSAHRTFTPSIEHLESREVPSRGVRYGPAVPQDWYARTFKDAAVAAEVRAAYADSVITRGELVAVFEKADDAGITKNELASLTSLSANADYLGLSDPLEYLTERIASSLSVTTAAETADGLVAKWFFGTVRPAANGVYQQTDGTLFVDGISYTDARQGKAADCWLIAGFATVAFQTPDRIAERFTDNGDGTWFVSFCRGASREWVTVDDWLPTNPDGTLVYAKAADGELWAALLEKAYAQWTRQDYTRGAFANGGHTSAAVAALTGTYSTPSDVSRYTEAGVATIFASGGYVYFDTLPTAKRPVVNYHVYVAVGYSAGTFTLYNPWGVNNGTAYPGVINVTWAQMQNSFY